MMAMRQILLGPMGGGGGWTNPYVTDGLVAMWDGEWNAGGGVHDAEATTWVDCVSGNALSADICSFTDNGMAFEQDWYSLAPVDSNAALAIQSGNYTVEIFAARKPNSGVAIFTASNPGNVGCHTEGGFTQWWIYNQNTASTSGVVWPTDSAGRSVVHNVASVTLSGNQFTVNAYYGNSIGTRTSGTGYASTSGRTPTWSAIKFRNNSFDSQLIYALRLYSRALTAAEIAANYAVDAQRFNLNGGA